MREKDLESAFRGSAKQHKPGTDRAAAAHGCRKPNPPATASAISSTTSNVRERNRRMGFRSWRCRAWRGSRLGGSGADVATAVPGGLFGGTSAPEGWVCGMKSSMDSTYVVAWYLVSARPLPAFAARTASPASLPAELPSRGRTPLRALHGFARVADRTCGTRESRVCCRRTMRAPSR